MDSTHEVNTYGYYLLNVVDPDEHKKGYPVVHLILNKLNKKIIRKVVSAHSRPLQRVQSSIRAKGGNDRRRPNDGAGFSGSFWIPRQTFSLPLASTKELDDSNSKSLK